jgi:transposase-like protein
MKDDKAVKCPVCDEPMKKVDHLTGVEWHDGKLEWNQRYECKECRTSCLIPWRFLQENRDKP